MTTEEIEPGDVPVVETNNLYDVIGNREIVHVDTDHGYIVVTAPRHFSEPAPPSEYTPVRLSDTRTVAIGPEYGTTSSPFATMVREEYNPDLRGLAGLRMYDKMRRNDGAVYGALLAVKTPINGADWFIEPSDQKAKSKKIAQFVEKNLFCWLTYSWKQVLHECLLSLDFGFYLFEKVWAIRQPRRGNAQVYLRKLAARHPMDVVQWKFDGNGGPRSVVLYDHPPTPESVEIGIEKLLVVTHDLEAGDIQGRSVLRSAYKHWFYAETAYKIDGIQKERHGIGIPIITLPMGFSSQDKALAHEIGRNLRTNESAHVVLPSNWEIIFAKLEGQPVSALETARHHSKMIYQNVLASALWGDSAQGSSEQLMEMFYKSVRHIADAIADALNQYVIPQLVGFNWPEVDEFPKLKVRKLGDTSEARELSFALRNHVGAGIIQVDDPLEAWARTTLNAPMLDPNSVRQVATPQMGGGGPDVGPPRQSKAANQKKQQSNKAGNDGSGTS